MIVVIGFVIVIVVLFTLFILHITYVKRTKNVLQQNDNLMKRNDHLERTLPDREIELKSIYLAKTEKAISQIHQNVSEVQTHIISQALSGQSATSLQLDMKNLIETTYSRMTQEFVGALADETDGLLRDLNENLCERIWDSVQQMKIEQNESPYIIPPNAILTYTKGNRTVVAIEQKPQVRTMGFSPKLVGEFSRKKSTSTSDRAYRFQLSFPYVYFFIAFDETKFRYYEIFFRNKPITSIKEHVYTPPLPNIHRDKVNYKPVCMGKGFIDQVRLEKTISRQCEEVVSEFWQRPFNAHLDSGMNKNTDSRLKSYSKWQEASQEDPMFILSVKWGKGRTVKSVIDEILKRRDMNHSNDNIDKKIRTMLESGVKDITKSLKDAIDSSKKNNTLRSGNLDPVVRQQLENVLVDHTKKVFENCAKL